MNQEEIKKEEFSAKREKEQYNHNEREKYWQDFWEKEETYRFDPDSTKPIFNIDTPPPTISGALHLGHIFSYTQAEIIARFNRMNGKSVRYPFGMDNNGLPTERLVEKESGVKGQDLSLEEFTKMCLDITGKYREEYKKLWQSVGLSVDWRLEYSTISPEVQKMSQETFKQLFDRGLIYKKNAPAIYCCECQTSFAQAEKEDKEKEVIFYDIKFKLENGTELIIATTRPELLPACVAVFVNPEDERFAKFVGQKVETPLGNVVEILSDEKVDIAKGSGAVMCCTYGDETDVYWTKKYNLPEKIIINLDGTFQSSIKLEGYNGSRAGAARQIIIEELRKRDCIAAENKITHSVDVHERCGTPVEYLPTTQWFVKVLDMKEKLLAAGRRIKWHPAHMQKRYEEWVSGLKWDWCISRERFYGIPIPAFSCDKCDYVQIPDSNDLPIDPKTMKGHKECPSCKQGILVPEKNVLDTWFTSAISPEVNNQSEYNGKLKGQMLPMSMRPQAHDIIRTWAMYSILMSQYFHQDIPWENLMISGHVLLRKGEKISKKSGGGKYKPEDLISKHSADTIRYAMSGASLGRDGYFDEKEVDKGRKLVTKVYNAGKLVLANLVDYKPEGKVNEGGLEAFDEWIIARSHEVASRMAQAFNDYEFAHARIIFEEFFWKEYCDNYLEIVKNRIKNQDTSKQAVKQKRSAQHACYVTYLNILKMASPFIPHITEEMYHLEFGKDSEGEVDFRKTVSGADNGLFAKHEGEKSIHTSNWPHNQRNLDEQINNGADLALLVISEVRKQKTAKGIKMIQKYPINIVCDQAKNELLQPFLADISSVVNAEPLGVENREIDRLDAIIVKI